MAQLATVRAIQFDSQRASDLKYICDIFRVVNKQYCIAILGIVNIVFSIAKVVQYFVNVRIAICIVSTFPVYWQITNTNTNTF